jgi:hypothetical protein
MSCLMKQRQCELSEGLLADLQETWCDSMLMLAPIWLARLCTIVLTDLEAASLWLSNHLQFLTFVHTDNLSILQRSVVGGVVEGIILG